MVDVHVAHGCSDPMVLSDDVRAVIFNDTAPATGVPEISAKLDEELKKAEREQTISEARRHIEFETANAAKQRPLNPEIERIVETVFVEHPFEEYKRLEKALELGPEKRSDHGSVNASLDAAERNARLAHRVMITAKAEQHRWELENAEIFAAMRLESTKVLQSEKDAGKRNKTITDADVDSMCARLFGDEWVYQQLKRRRVDLAVKNMDNLVDVWTSRCNSLRVIFQKQR